jgi:hypothetical protein
MTILSVILSFFPTLVLLMAGASFLWVCIAPSLLSVLALIFSLYGFPLLAYRIHTYLYPIEEGISYLIGEAYSPWWGSHQLQVIYIAFPALEVVLRLIPGAFSIWLRLWGSKVGNYVYWTPEFQIADRGLVEIGDNTILGHRVGVYSHVIKPRKNNLMLFVKKIKIGNQVFLGAGSTIGPGVAVDDGTFVPANTILYPNQKIE